MGKRIAATVVIALICVVGFGVTKWVSVEGKDQPGTGFAAVPGEKGGQDMSGAYEVVPDWPKPLAQLPGHEKWTWGAMQGVYAESPDRILITMRGELPLLKRPLNLRRTHTCGALRASDAGQTAVLMGWVNRRRDFGNLVFIDVRDRTGITQIVCDKESNPALHAKAG